MAIEASAILVDGRKSVTETKPKRLLSLDLLRGLTIGFMILVNNNGSGAHYAQLDHAPWNGFTLTDLVFPTFLFLVGISIVFSINSRLARGDSRRSIFLHTVRRSVILFLLGLFVNCFPHFRLHEIRYYGVLPRIAICYLIVATLYLLSPKWQSKLVLVVSILVSYWILMRFVPVPGYGVPGRDIPLLDPNRNLAAWLDRHIFSAQHLYDRTFDPEGALSTVTAVATTLIGLLTGCWLSARRDLTQKLCGIALAGVGSIVLGRVWSIWFPLNKRLWTSSFVLYAAGWGLLLLALTVWMLDRGTSERSKPSVVFIPLLVFGSNAITAYVFAEMLGPGIRNIYVRPGIHVQRWLCNGILRVVPHPAFASLLFSLGFVAVCWVPMYWLYRKRIFIKV